MKIKRDDVLKLIICLCAILFIIVLAAVSVTEYDKYAAEKRLEAYNQIVSVSSNSQIIDLPVWIKETKNDSPTMNCSAYKNPNEFKRIYYR